jgi:hypothetical protein
VLTLGMVLWLDWVTVRHDRRQTLFFRGLAVVLVALIGVMLLSASGRMSLYEQAYGFTHLRVYTHVFMHWLAVLFVVFLLGLFRLRDRLFSVGMLAVLIGFLVTLNLMNVEGYIAERNIDRYLSGSAISDLDICYLRSMSTDAVPAMLALYQDPRTKESFREHVGYWLTNELNWLDRMNTYGNAGLLSWNYSRATAYALLNPLRDDLKTQTATYSEDYRSCYLYGSY